MMVMVAANSNPLLHMLAGKYEGSLGWMMSPATGFMRPYEWLPYAVDNGKYAAYSNNEKWNADKFFGMLDRCRLEKCKPRWIVCPDEIGDKDGTKKAWRNYRSEMTRYGWPVAFVAQDGMSTNDVPYDSDLVFIGGSTEWKWRNVALFAATFDRVHVGRVSAPEKLEYCLRLGIESVDGSGFFREGNGKRAQPLVQFISGRRIYEEQPQITIKVDG